MAGLWYSSTDPVVVNVWERDLGREVRAFSPLLDPQWGFTGKSDTSMIQLKDQLTDGPGRSITTKLRYQLSGRGRAGEETLKGNGEAYKVATYAITVNVLRHYVETSSPMVDQWVPEDTLVEGRDGLADWFAKRYEFSLNLHGGAFSLVTDPAYTLHNTINAPHADYILRPGGKAAVTDLTSSDVFDVDFLNDVARQIKLIRPKLRPAKTPRGDRFAVFLAPEQVWALRKSDSVWFATMQQALAGGRVDDNPIFTNALGEWGNFIFFESDLVPPGINGSSIADKTRRAWIGGAQALFLAHGRGRSPSAYGVNRYQWKKETEDFDHVGQMAATTIVGVGRPRYTKPGEASARENGVVVLETYADYGSLTNTDVYRDWIDAGGGLSIV